MNEVKVFLTIFATVFVAEMGDKTQLATLLFASDDSVRPWAVFFAASLALMATTALGVLAGNFVSRHIDPHTLQLAAGVGFIAIGLWTLIGAVRQ